MLIQFDNVTKLYGNVIGVNDITLSLEPGAYGLLGPNGSGKSTFLNLITGQLRPTLGRVRVFGHTPRNNSKLFRRIGYCPSSEGLYTDVSAFRWVQFLQQLGGMSAGEAAQAAESALDQVGILEAMHRPISTYSRGMRQRVKLAQAIAHDPEFLVLDEPFSGLDPVGRIELSELFRTWIAAGKCLLLASHLLHEVESITGEFLLICGGRLLATGTVDDVHEMLTDVPNNVTIRCSNPKRLAAILLELDAGETFRIDEQAVSVATRNPGKLFGELPMVLAQSSIEVTEIHSADESLQTLFTSLTKIHRGEM